MAEGGVEFLPPPPPCSSKTVKPISYRSNVAPTGGQMTEDKRDSWGREKKVWTSEFKCDTPEAKLVLVGWWVGHIKVNISFDSVGIVH